MPSHSYSNLSLKRNLNASSSLLQAFLVMESQCNLIYTRPSSCNLNLISALFLRSHLYSNPILQWNLNAISSLLQAGIATAISMQSHLYSNLILLALLQVSIPPWLLTFPQNTRWLSDYQVFWDFRNSVKIWSINQTTQQRPILRPQHSAYSGTYQRTPKHSRVGKSCFFVLYEFGLHIQVEDFFDQIWIQTTVLLLLFGAGQTDSPR